jgi:Protein of unknown function (DUF3370)
MNTRIIITFFAAGIFTACKKQEQQTALLQDTAQETGIKKNKTTESTFAARTVTVSEWTAGLLPVTTNVTQHILPDNQLKPLEPTYSGDKMYVSNNPEIFTGNGWLMQNSRTDAIRGGASYALAGLNNVYLFHINQSGASKYIHLMISNPNTTNITYTGKGSYYTNAEKPLTGKATGQSYFVAKDWLNNTFRKVISTAVTVQPGKVSEVFKIQMNSSNMVDARFELNSSAAAYCYTVITSTGSLTDAVNATQGSFASGTYVAEGTNSYGREAGVYSTSDVTASNVLQLPSTSGHIGFCLNTTAKFKQVEEQTSAALMTMTGASSRSYGNYGIKYNISFQLQNNNTTARTVKLYFASNAVDATKSNSTWNGQVKLNGSNMDVYTQLNNPRQLLATWTVPAGIFNMTLNFFVPGLITTNQQLIFESY